MYNEINERRMDIAITLLSQLKSVHRELSDISSDIEKYYGSFYEQYFQCHKKEIQIEIDKYNENIIKIKESNYTITEKINAWYDFIKDPVQMKKLSFPITFFRNAQKLKRDIKAINNEIYRLTIENRLIVEKLTNWEQQLEVEVIKEIKQGEDFVRYDELKKMKNLIIKELQYILPTVCARFPLELDVANVDKLMQKLKKVNAA